MNVAFKRTGARRYAVIVTRAGESAQALDPAPGYDDDIPHDLVHYVVEAELGLWRALLVDQALAFEWPDLLPNQRRPDGSGS